VNTEETIAALDRGDIRVAEKVDGEWRVNEDAKAAILDYFRISKLEPIEVGPYEYVDKIPLKHNYAELGVRVVPPATARFGSFLSRGVVMMPSYVNIGAWVGPNTMIDTWATVGSCAQIGADVHLAGGVGVGGVLEPIQARPVIVEDGAFIGSRCILTEGVLIGERAVLAPNVSLTGSVPVIDVTGPFVARQVFQVEVVRPLGEASQFGQPVGHPVHRRPGDHQQPEAADQGQQWRGDPRRQGGHQRGRDEEADQAGAGAHGALPGGWLWRARRDVHQAEAAQQQAGPADHHPPGLRVAVGMAQEPPGEQAEQEGHGPGGRAERAEEHVGEHPAGEVVHVEPGGGGDDEGCRQEGQADAVPLVHRIQVPGAVPEPAGAEPDRVRGHHPQSSHQPDQPAGQDQDRVGRPLR